MTEWHFYEPEAGHGLRHDPLNAIVAPRPYSWALRIWPTMLMLASTRNATAGTTSTAASLERTRQLRGRIRRTLPSGLPAAGRSGAPSARFAFGSPSAAEEPSRSPPNRPRVESPGGGVARAAGCSAGRLSTSSRDLPNLPTGSRISSGHYRATECASVNVGENAEA